MREGLITNSACKLFVFFDVFDILLRSISMHYLHVFGEVELSREGLLTGRALMFIYCG